MKPERLLAHAAVDHLVEADEGAAADEQDVGGVDLEELLVRVLAPALGRHVGHRAFEDLQERLLDALTRHVARDRGVLVLAADLVDLVDVDDALLALLDVATGGLQQLEDDVLDVLADVAGLGEGGRVHDRERHREELGQRLRQQRLAGAGGADEQDVRLVELDVVAAARLLLDLDALVVVVDRDRELLLGAFLADHVLVEELLDFRRRGQRRADAAVLEPVVVGDDVVADLDALVADEDRRSGNQLADVVLILVAERAAKNLGLAVLLDHASYAYLLPLAEPGFLRAVLAIPLHAYAYRREQPGTLNRVYTRFRMTSSIIPYSFPWSADMM